MGMRRQRQAARIKPAVNIGLLIMRYLHPGALREQARWLDENHDIVIGLLDKMEERIIGAKGIQIEPQPRSLTGEILTGLAAELRHRWAAWTLKLLAHFLDHRWSDWFSGRGFAMVMCQN